ncbi:MAG: DUF1800 domain-containing protein [Actinomycetota bacterium]
MPSTTITSTATHAATARILRRLTFGPAPGQLDELGSRDPAELVRELLDRPALDAPPTHPGAGTDEEWDAPIRWWLARMSDPAAGVHERIVWFWHGHLTSSIEKVGDWAAIWDQHLLVRRHALGNVRELLQAITVDRAMLWYLDGEGSWGDEPNENYSRELMELFALGRGNYTEDDVRSGARALSGWRIDWTDDGPGGATFDPEAHGGRPVTFLDRRVLDAADVIDAVCDHPAIGPHLASALHVELVGRAPGPGRAEELGRVLVEADLEVRPLVEAIVTSPDLLDPDAGRFRTGVEWAVAAANVLDVVGELGRSSAELVGQVPFVPPDVAGWHHGPGWVSPGRQLGRLTLLSWLDGSPPLADGGPADVVDALLRRCGLVQVSDETRATLLHAAATYPDDPTSRSHLLHVLALMSPELSRT